MKRSQSSSEENKKSTYLVWFQDRKTEECYHVEFSGVTDIEWTLDQYQRNREPLKNKVLKQY